MAFLYTLLAGAALLSAPMTRADPAPRPASSAYAGWSHGPSSRRDDFPIGVWLQSPANAAKYQAAGINLYVGLWQGPTEEQLAALKAAHMPVICEQNAVGLAHREDPTIVGWMHGDEPDNAQPVTDPATGKQGYGPEIPPARILADYARLRAADPTRPIMLNLGEGVANDEWVGRGPGATLGDYPEYLKGSDIVSFDVYPVAGLNKPDGENYLWYVAKGVTRLFGWTGGRKPVWSCIECTHISSAQKPTPRQVRSEVWLALIHGARGLIYFVHEFQPKFNEHALLDNPPMLAEVTRINQQIHALAPVLNSPTIAQAATVHSSSAQTPIDLMVKRQGKITYLFAVGTRRRRRRSPCAACPRPPAPKSWEKPGRSWSRAANSTTPSVHMTSISTELRTDVTQSPTRPEVRVCKTADVRLRGQRTALCGFSSVREGGHLPL